MLAYEEIDFDDDLNFDCVIRKEEDKNDII
jgi:hypothetical protein